MPSTLPQSSGSILVIIGIICLTIGYVFGWLISSFRPKENKDKKEADPDTNSILAQQPDKEVVSGNAAVLKLWRDANQGKLLVELDGKVFDQPSSLTIEQRKRLEGGLRETAVWMGLVGQSSTEAAPKPASAAPVIQMPPVPTQRPTIIPGGVTGVLADAFQPAPKKEVLKSIVEQIDEVLQRMLVGSVYENEKIFLMEDPKRGVLVRVGTQVYEGIGSVPEGDIKNMLKAAVAEWEKQQEQANFRKRTV